MAKHPSIWQRDYRWNVSHGASTTTQTSDVQTKKSATRQSKRSIKVTESVEESEIPENPENDENLLNEYAQLGVPSQKRFKEDIGDFSDEDGSNGNPSSVTSSNRKITPNRNPFKKPDKCTDELLSPTQITKENNSLIKNQSPVKRIDYKRLEKLSRFSRTVSSNKNKNVLSKFFNTGTTSEDDESSKQNSDLEIETKSENSELCAQTDLAVRVHFSESGDSAFSSNGENSNGKSSRNESMNDEDNGKSNGFDKFILEKFTYNYSRMIQNEKETEKDLEENDFMNSQKSTDKTDSEISETPITVSDESNDTDNDVMIVSEEAPSRGTVWLSSSQKVTPST